MTRTMDDAAGLISIGELAKAAGVSSRTIRYYEELGILPEPRRTPGGTRKYPSEYQAYLEAALALKDLGFRLEEIKPLAKLALGRSLSAGQRSTAARLVDGRIEELARQVSLLRRLRDTMQVPDGPAGASGAAGAAGAISAAGAAAGAAGAIRAAGAAGAIRTAGTAGAAGTGQGSPERRPVSAWIRPTAPGQLSRSR